MDVRKLFGKRAEPAPPRITVKVGDVFKVARFGRVEQIRITALTDKFIYFCSTDSSGFNGIPRVMLHKELKETILDLSRIRYQVEL